MEKPNKRPKLLSRRKKMVLIGVVVVCYGGLIGLGLSHYSDSRLFLAVLAVMALLPPVLAFGLMHGMSRHIDRLYREIDKQEDEEES